LWEERKIRICLIRPSYSSVYDFMKEKVEKKHVYPPLGLMYIASYLQKDDHEVMILDAEVDNIITVKEITRRLEEFDPDIVGCGATTPEIEMSEAILKSAKDNLGVMTVAGGPHATALPEDVLRNSFVDFVVRGEGEETMSEIVSGCHVTEIDGLSYRHLGEIRHNRERDLLDVHTLLFPARDLINNEKYVYPVPKKGMRPATSIQTSRGCPNRCTFCYHMFGSSIRFRDPQSVVDEIEECITQYGTEFVVFVDDTFTCSKDHVVQICEAIMRRKLEIPWFCQGRVDTILRNGEETLDIMKRAGCEKFSVGVESGNQQQLNRVKKGNALENIRKAISLLKRKDFDTDAGFIIGLPYDTEKTIEETVQFAMSLDLDRANFNVMTPYPCTEIFDQAEKGDGIHFVNTDWKRFKRWGNAVIRTDEVSADRLIELQKDAHMRFYLRPRIIEAHLKEFYAGNDSAYYHRPLLNAIHEWEKRLK